MRPGDLRRLAPLALSYALVVMSVYVLKPAQNALFLDSLGIAQRPYVLLLVCAGLLSACILLVRTVHAPAAAPSRAGDGPTGLAEALGNLVAGMAHEINTPVGAIHNMNDTLTRASGCGSVTRS